MNYERFVAANGIALVTHAVVSSFRKVYTNDDFEYLDSANWHGQN